VSGRPGTPFSAGSVTENAREPVPDCEFVGDYTAKVEIHDEEVHVGWLEVSA
jgi:hypothetical protein